MMGRHQYINEDEYEVNLKDFEPQPGKISALAGFPLRLVCRCTAACSELVGAGGAVLSSRAYLGHVWCRSSTCNFHFRMEVLGTCALSIAKGQVQMR